MVLVPKMGQSINWMRETCTENLVLTKPRRLATMLRHDVPSQRFFKLSLKTKLSNCLMVADNNNKKL